MTWYEPLLDKGLIPDSLLRAGIRKRLRRRIAAERSGTIEQRHARFRQFLRGLRESPIAIETDKANEQHYELPARFFEHVLGANLKYSGCYWPEGVTSLNEAEEAMLELTCQRAGIEDGMRILDLGCGWGSLSFFIKRRFPRCQVLAVSNSRPQREFIESKRNELGLTDLDVVTADANEFNTDRRFDRIVSVEMFEHMKNYRSLLNRLSGLLAPDGRLFIHIFTHREIAYHYEPGNDWIGRYFFTGGTMPSDHLLHHFQDDLVLEDHWRVGGEHYEKTANAWLANMDERKAEIMPVLVRAYAADAPAWFNRWRVFFMACAELWGLDRGSQWIVSHYRFRPRVAVERARSAAVASSAHEPRPEVAPSHRPEILT